MIYLEPYLEYKYKVEFGKPEYDEIDKYCKSKEIAWSASPWDLDSLAFLNEYDIPYQLLNAKPENVESESRIVAQAGCKKAITISSPVKATRKATGNTPPMIKLLAPRTKTNPPITFSKV